MPLDTQLLPEPSVTGIACRVGPPDRAVAVIHRLLPALLLTFVAAAAQAAPIYRAQFVETRILAGANHPLVLHGHLRFVPGHRFLWAIDRPYRYRLEIQNRIIRQTFPDGRTQTSPLAKVPWAEVLFKLFPALLGGNTSALERFFHVTRTATGSVLVPRSATLARSVRRIIVSGRSSPHRILIEEAGGSRTRLDFTAEAAVPPPASGDPPRNR